MEPNDRMQMPKNTPVKTALISLLLVIVVVGTSLGQAAANPAEAGPGLKRVLPQTTQPVPTDILTAPPATPEPTPTATPIPVGIQVYSPLMQRSPLDPVGIDRIYTGTDSGVLQSAFQPGTPLNYILQGTNYLHIPITVNIRWTLVGPCGVTTLDQETVTAPPGGWFHPIAGIAPAAECMGIYSAYVELEHDSKIYTTSQPALYVISSESALVVSDKQGFDRGRLPSVEQMQTWWDNSPYWVFNLYLGGASLYYKNEPLDAAWVYQAAQQGWSFILTWVGPQAPCTSYSNRISINPTVAFAQGGYEAEQAVLAARNLGFLGEKSIYYDMESYAGASDSCRLAVKEFLRGWTERLHSYDVRSGAYGSACYYMPDWATISTPPDDVWIAHWIRNYYDANMTVWNTVCLDNALWPNQQRMRQYAGDHTETWGGIALTIDSNVIDARVNVLPSGLPAAQTVIEPATLLGTGVMIDTIDLLSPASGYAVLGNRLLWGDGREWRALDLGLAAPDEILGVHFEDETRGWVVARTFNDDLPALEVLHTRDRGQRWERQALPLARPMEVLEVARAYPGSQDGALGWIALQIQSSRAFDLGRLLTTRDGGSQWQEQDLPLGAPVELFADGRGWQVGADLGLAYQTSDCGRTWQPAASAALPAVLSQGEPTGESTGAASALPANTVQSAFSDSQHGWALVQDGTCRGEKRNPAYEGEIPLLCYQGTRLLATADGGLTWTDITPDK
jgi:photosystem II stability/assembly factor-like uncharacterized protein